MGSDHSGASPGADTDRLLRRLDRAVRSGELIRVGRSIRGADRIDGFAVAASPGWTVLAVCTDVQLDGWSAVRTADITEVRRRGDDTCLTIRALRRRGQWPVRPPLPAVPPDDLPGLLQAAGRGFGLIAVGRERQQPDACWIGAVAELRPKSLRLHEVDPDARWHPDVSGFRFKDITRIDFGGRYEQTLQEFAGPRR
ncbi:hypothetical protein [Kitasatospora sp. DSM 101779]|uniref:hypothetical protein n=1 Tax=Kitasatospora sp. DSM 101779 TaxID=2853165 RepID=UPI0021DA46BB|nr:hypothetical protein [Kitasatospora sp. DSM 101779]MCU7826685.1 hypothetical protein [Kitasatospora sp. DSM 101779]